jgi:low affinity Fe/Cu permease
MTHARSGLAQWFERISTAVTAWTGTTPALLTAAGIIATWLVTGPLFRFSDTWQLVINTGTTIITFLMVFVIQRAQNKDSLAIHLKLNELVAAMQGASNRLIDVEDLSEAELKVLRRFYRGLSELSKKESDLGTSHSLDEAHQRHKLKRAAMKSAR